MKAPAAPRGPLFVDHRRGWEIQLRDIHSASGRGWFCSLIDPQGREHILVQQRTATEALARARDFIDDEDTITNYRRAGVSR